MNLVPFREQVEEQFPSGPLERDEPQLVEDQEIRPPQASVQQGQRPLVAGLSPSGCAPTRRLGKTLPGSDVWQPPRQSGLLREFSPSLRYPLRPRPGLCSETRRLPAP